jgi:polyisoprenoid-binding protein YceI
VGLLLSSLTLVAVAHAGVESIGDSMSSFMAVGPGGLKIEGKGKGITVKEAGGKITVSAPLKGLSTGISLRDNHLKDAIKADKYPTATLVVARSALKFPENDKTVEASAQGDFTFHGNTKKIPFQYKAKRTGSDYHVQGMATIKIDDFKMEQPCYLGVCVDKEVKVKVKFKVRDK